MSTELEYCKICHEIDCGDIACEDIADSEYLRANGWDAEGMAMARAALAELEKEGE